MTKIIQNNVLRILSIEIYSSSSPWLKTKIGSLSGSTFSKWLCIILIIKFASSVKYKSSD